MANTGGFLSGFRAGRSDTFQREQAKRQDEALRYKMGLDIFDVQLKVSKENREQAIFQTNEDERTIANVYAVFDMDHQSDYKMTDDEVAAFKRTGMDVHLKREPIYTKGLISAAQTSLEGFQNGTLDASQAWTSEVEDLMNDLFANELNLLEGSSITGKKIVKRRIKGIRPAINPETGEMLMAGENNDDPVLNVMIEVTEEGSTEPLPQLYPLTKLRSADPNDELEPFRMSRIAGRITGLDKQMDWKLKNPEDAGRLLKMLNRSGITTNVYTGVDYEADIKGKFATLTFDEIKGAIDDAKIAQEDIRSLKQTATLLNTIELRGYGHVLGAGGDRYANLMAWGARLGFNVDKTALATIESFFTAQGEMTLDYVQFTKGAVSEKEMELFAKMSVGLSRTLAGNKALVAMKLNAAQNVINKAEMARDFKRRVLLPKTDPNYMSPESWDTYYTNWLNSEENSVLKGNGITSEMLKDITRGTTLAFMQHPDSSFGGVAGQWDVWIKVDGKPSH